MLFMKGNGLLEQGKDSQISEDIFIWEEIEQVIEQSEAIPISAFDIGGGQSTNRSLLYLIANKKYDQMSNVLYKKLRY